MNIYQVNKIFILTEKEKEALFFYNDNFPNYKGRPPTVRKCKLQEEYWYEFDSDNLFDELINMGYKGKEGNLLSYSMKIPIEKIIKIEMEMKSKLSMPRIVLFCFKN